MSKRQTLLVEANGEVVRVLERPAGDDAAERVRAEAEAVARLHDPEAPPTITIRRAHGPKNGRPGRLVEVERPKKRDR